jgi:hypothetical protein
MPRPKSKEELLSLATNNFKKLFEIVNSFPRQKQLAEYIFDNNRDKNIRDILTHLHHWHTMVMDWHTIGMKGETPHKPAKGYTWKTLPAWNKKVWEMYQETNFETAVQLINKSHKQVLNIVNEHSNNELFEKKKYKWTGSTNMASYFISATSSHYDWAIKHLKKYKKSL